METFLKDRQDIKNFVTGCAFYSTGGGGDPQEGERFLNEALENGKSFLIKRVDEIGDDEWICCAYYVGSIAPIPLVQRRQLEGLGLGVLGFRAFTIAFRELEKLLGLKISALMPTELGGLNSSTSVAVAAETGLPVVDGDFAGRAIPESTQSLTSIFGIPIRPLVLCDSGGNVSIIKEAKNWMMLERIGKMISVAGGGLTATVGKLVTGRELKATAIWGSVRKCYMTGQQIMRSTGEVDPAAFARSLDGWLFFKGRVSAKNWEDKEGYMYGEITIQGIKEYSDHELRVWFKNENHLSWYDGSVFVTSPDLISIVRIDNLQPLTNTNIQEGDSVSVFGFPCDKRYRNRKGIEVLGPAHFGFDYPYVSIEQVLTAGKDLKT